MKRVNILRILLVLSLVLAVGGCAKKPVPGQPGGYGPGGGGEGYGPGAAGGGTGLDDAKWRELGIHSEAEKKEFLDKAREFENQDVYFDFDSQLLSVPAKKILDEKAAFMKRYPKVKVNIEGHCDERGTTEYNLALGERRARTALDYLVNSGVGAGMMSTISYGKERPQATGHDEASWAKNRRDHFVLNY